MNSYNKYFKFTVAYIAFSFTTLQGVDFLLKKYSFNDINFNYLIISLLGIFVIGILYIFLNDRKSNKKVSKNNTSKRKYFIGANILLTSALLILFIYFFRISRNSEKLLQSTLPEIIKAYDENRTRFVFSKTNELLQDFPENLILKDYYKKVTEEVEIKSSPSNLDVYIKITNDSLGKWEFIGKTPLKSRVPNLSFNIKFKNNDTFYFAVTHPYYLKNKDNNFILPKSLETFPNTTIILGGNKTLSIPGFDHLPYSKIGAYAISHYEVTNKEYKVFVDSGGYSNSSYWELPIGKNMDFVKKVFTDKFSNTGPSTWSYGNYPDGQDDYPVAGISFYEALAYANFKNASIPNIYQWANAATLSSASSFISASNFSKSQLHKVGSNENSNRYSLYDIAGNAREWVINPSEKNQDFRAILGGSYLDDPYFFNDFYSQNSLDRSPANGIRLVYNLNPAIQNYEGFVGVEKRDFLSEKRISDDVFELLLSQYDYPEKPLEVKIIPLKDVNGSLKVERYEITSAYSDEKLPGYVFFDSKHKGPYKPIIFFPGSNAIHLTNTDVMIKKSLRQFDYLLKEGYAVFHPIYISTYEREDNLKSDYPDQTDFYKDHVIKWGKDYKRTIDYISSRSDMDLNSLSYYGISWGGSMGNILLAIDDRVKKAVLYVGGLSFQKSKTEVEAVNYTSRIKIPVLMMNGKFDQFFPLKTSQIPMFKLLGTKAKDKKHYLFETGHYVPREKLIIEHLDWIK